MKTTLSAQRANELLAYNPDTGIITRKISLSRSVRAGDVAGCVHPKGCVYLYVDGSRYLAHRIAWLITYGDWPNGVIDHINRCRSDNRISNLRDVTVGINSENISAVRPNTSGLAGVSWMSRAKKWRAQISVNKKVLYLGIFNSKEEAHSEYLSAKRKHHAGCTI